MIKQSTSVLVRRINIVIGVVPVKNSRINGCPEKER